MNFNLHFALLYASINTFWDRVPLGRVSNRVQSDTSNVENGLAQVASYFFSQIFSVLQQ